MDVVKKRPGECWRHNKPRNLARRTRTGSTLI